MWRKTRSQNAGFNRGDNCVGVDPNRNWGYKWGGVGASTDPCHETYRGSSSFSEVETAAVRDFLTSKSGVRLYLTYHSYGQMILYPWGYDRSDAPNWQWMDKVGKVAGKAMKAKSGNSYTVGSAAKVLWPAAGETSK